MKISFGTIPCHVQISATVTPASVCTLGCRIDSARQTNWPVATAAALRR